MFLKIARLQKEAREKTGINSLEIILMNPGSIDVGLSQWASISYKFSTRVTLRNNWKRIIQYGRGVYFDHKESDCLNRAVDNLIISAQMSAKKVQDRRTKLGRQYKKIEII